MVFVKIRWMFGSKRSKALNLTLNSFQQRAGAYTGWKPLEIKGVFRGVFARIDPVFAALPAAAGAILILNSTTN